MTEPKVLFCIGAQKTGTTWLYKYLQEYDEVHFHRTKELQFFNNARYVRNLPERDNRPESLVQENLKKIRLKQGQYDKQPWKKWRLDRVKVLEEVNEFLGNEAGFIDIIRRTMSDSATIVADMTPEYAFLGAETFREMLMLVADVRFVYIMRDPVDRAWSNLRFAARTSKSDPDELLTRVLQDPTCRLARQLWAHSRYDLTLGELDKSVPEERRFETFYESLFDEVVVRKLTSFLGLAYRHADLEKVVFGTKPKPLDPDFEKLAMTKLAPAYADIRNRFGRDVPESWRTQLDPQ